MTNVEHVQPRAFGATAQTIAAASTIAVNIPGPVPPVNRAALPPIIDSFGAYIFAHTVRLLAIELVSASPFHWFKADGGCGASSIPSRDTVRTISPCSLITPSNQEAAIHLDVSQRSSASITATVGRFERQLYHLTRVTAWSRAVANEE
jgi:hypothetical protein